MKTIEQAIIDKKRMTDKIAEAIREFEEVYGPNSVGNIHIHRWNGSNSAFGRVVDIRADVVLC